MAGHFGLVTRKLGTVYTWPTSGQFIGHDRRVEHMGIVERFDAAVIAEAAAYPEAELLPVRLTRACVRVLPIGGAGISALAHPDLRLPIGASDDVAGYVERLQFTYGEGPCLHAYTTGRPQLIAGE